MKKIFILSLLSLALGNLFAQSTIEGINPSTLSSAFAVKGTMSSTSPGAFSAAVRGQNNGTGGLGIGVWGSQAGAGWGVYGSSINGIGVNGLSTSGTAIYGTTSTGIAAFFSISGNSNTNSTINSSTAGLGSVADFSNTNASNTADVVHISSNGTGNGISAQITNASSGAKGVNIANAGLGHGVYSTSAGGTGVEGITSSISSAGVIGRNATGEAIVGFSSGASGVGAVVGRSDGAGYGVRGFNTLNGIGVFGQAGISGGTGRAARFENVNSANASNTMEVATNGTGIGIDVSLSNASSSVRAVGVANAGVGHGVYSTSAGGTGVEGITSSISSAGVIGRNATGEAIVGFSSGTSGVGAVVGRSDGAGYGVRGFNTLNGIGVFGQAGISGGTGKAARFENNNAANTTNVFEIASTSTSNLAVFIKSGLNVARIDATGKGFFNGGTQASGADLAEAFDVEGITQNYEAGDVMVISTKNDRTLAKSDEAYSNLVVGVYATKPGVLLTEENIDNSLTDKIPLGVVGVIPTKVCLEGGKIKRGDFLVTSSQKGVAMKADLSKIKIGQLIGKALQDYDDEIIGKIKVLVNVR